MPFLRGFLLASLAAAIAFTLGIAGIERQGDAGSFLAGLAVFLVYALCFTAVLAPVGLFILHRLGRDDLVPYAIVGAGLGWLGTLVLYRTPAGLLRPLALAFALAGLAGGLAFRLGHGRARASRRIPRA
jgi:hypothetical protein